MHVYAGLHMRKITDYEITEMMAQYGGSFAHALAEAARHADPEHFVRLKDAIPELWAQYRDLADHKYNGLQRDPSQSISPRGTD
jgi:hypothetical protein